MAEKTTAAPWSIPYPTSAVGEAKLGATDMQEIAERVTAIFGERLATFATHGSSFTAKSGELAEMTGAGATCTLPTATVNSIVSVFFANTGSPVKITTSGGALIFGDFVSSAGTIQLAPFQHVTLIANGTSWLIIAGEPQRQSAYVVHGSLAKGTPTEYSATRQTLVIANFYSKIAEQFRVKVLVAGVEISEASMTPAASTNYDTSITFILPAGQKWEWTVEGGHEPLECNPSTLEL